jgi:hypothetical protein
MVPSSSHLATSWIPIGSFSELKAEGVESAGSPVMLKGQVAAGLDPWLADQARPARRLPVTLL